MPKVQPEARNCVDAQTARLLFEAVDQFRGDAFLGVLILTGDGDPIMYGGMIAQSCM